MPKILLSVFIFIRSYNCTNNSSKWYYYSQFPDKNTKGKILNYLSKNILIELSLKPDFLATAPVIPFTSEISQVNFRIKTERSRLIIP